jgi:hypothetical protein
VNRDSILSISSEWLPDVWKKMKLKISCFGIPIQDCFTQSEDGAPGSGSEEEEETGPKNPLPPPQPSSSSSSLWGPPQHERRGSNNFSGGAVGVNLNTAPHVNMDPTPLCVFMLYFTAIIHLLVVETNRYYHQYIDRLDDRPSPLPDVTDSEMFPFLGIVIQMGHDIRDRVNEV